MTETKHTPEQKWTEEPGFIAWRTVAGFESYEVSSRGDVRGKARCVNLKQRRDHKGYPTVWLYKNRRRRAIGVHRLVARAFIGRGRRGYQINHRDGNKANNHVRNLEWVTASQNTQHAYDNGLSPRGSNHYCAKLNAWRVRVIRRAVNAGISKQHLADVFGVGWTTVAKAASGETWSHVRHP